MIPSKSFEKQPGASAGGQCVSIAHTAAVYHSQFVLCDAVSHFFPCYLDILSPYTEVDVTQTCRVTKIRTLSTYDTEPSGLIPSTKHIDDRFEEGLEGLPGLAFLILSGMLVR